MTVQVKERIYYKGELRYTNDYPLDEYIKLFMLEMKSKSITDIHKPVLIYKSTACWRGYEGTWEIRDNKLYLIDLNDYPKSSRPFGMDALFPNQTEVFADWFTGEIRIPHGEILISIFYGPDTHEENHILKFQDGYLIDSKIVDNYDRAAKIRDEMKKINDVPYKAEKPLKGLRKIFHKWYMRRVMSNLRKKHNS